MPLFKRQRRTKQKGYLSWDEYTERISRIDSLTFSQKVRNQSVKNMPGCGGN